MGFKLISLLLLFLPLLTVTILSGAEHAFASDKTLLVNGRNGTAGSGDGGRSSLRGNKQRRASGCNLFQGRWVFDASYPFYDSSTCPFIDGEFNCLKFGRPDKQFLKYSWQPGSCTIPSLHRVDSPPKSTAYCLLTSARFCLFSTACCVFSIAKIHRLLLLHIGEICDSISFKETPLSFSWYDLSVFAV